MTPLTAVRIAEKAYSKYTFVQNEIEVLFEPHDKFHVLAFRGTEASSLNAIFRQGGWRDIIRDLRFIPWYDKRVGWAHSGFLKGAKAVDRIIVNSPRKETILIGHSLGGALALIVALMMK